MSHSLDLGENKTLMKQEFQSNEALFNISCFKRELGIFSNIMTIFKTLLSGFQ